MIRRQEEYEGTNRNGTRGGVKLVGSEGTIWQRMPGTGLREVTEGGRRDWKELDRLGVE